MEQSVGADGIGIQVDGNRNTVTVLAGASRLTIERRHLARRAPETERDLLLTEFRATNLVGREPDLAALEAWLVSKRPIAVHCLIARAGTGKTRIGIELCERAERDGWLAGFCTLDELRRFSAQQSLADWRWRDKTLIVVDYAAAGAAELRLWLASLARRRPGEPALRLLLLERHADPQFGWWADLASPGGLSGRGPDDLLDPVAAVALPSLAKVGDRRALLEEVMAEAARLRGVAAPPLPAPGIDALFDAKLGDDLIDNEPLYLILAGVVAVETGAPAALTYNRDDLAFRVADAERARLARLAAAAGIAERFFIHVAACATLQGGCTADEAEHLLTEEAEALGMPLSARLDECAVALATALPVPDSAAIDAVRPDLVGEAFAMRHLLDKRRSPKIQHALIERAFRRAGPSVTSCLIRTAQDFAAGDANHPAVTWLRHLVDKAESLDELISIAGQMPAQTVVLQDTSYEVDRKIIEKLRSLYILNIESKDDYDNSMKRLLSISLNNMSNRLSSLGRHEEALTAAEEAVGIRFALADARPDAFGPDLTSSLGNLSNCLSGLGRREEALAAIEETVALYRTLAGARPDAFGPDLARSLNNLSNRLSDLGRREAALEAIEEAVAIRRTLAGAHPDTSGPDLAGSLNNLSNRLSDLGRREEALAAIEEAVAIRRTLAGRRPDAFGPDLALSLGNLSNHLSGLGRREEALAAIEEAVALHRALAGGRPDAFGPDLARSLGNFSNRLSDLGRQEEALAGIEEAVALHRALAGARPDAFSPDLARSLNNLSNRLSDLGRREEALTAIEEAVAIRRPLAGVRPDAFGPDFARSLGNLSNRLSDHRRREEALAAIEETVALHRALARARPDAFGPDLAGSLNNLSNRLSDLGRREAALAAIEEAVAIRRTLAGARPDAFGPDLAGSLNNLSNRLSDLGRREAALAAIEEAVAIRRTLAGARPDAFGPNLASALNNLSNRLSDLGRREAALAAIEEAVTLYRALAGARPDAFNPDLARSLWILADRRDENGDREAGLAAHIEAITTLSEPFQHLPSAFASLMAGMVQAYVKRCETLHREPETELINPILTTLSALNHAQEDAS